MCWSRGKRCRHGGAYLLRGRLASGWSLARAIMVEKKPQGAPRRGETVRGLLPWEKGYGEGNSYGWRP